MEGHDEGAKLFFVEVLDFVDAEGDGAVSVGGGFCHSLKEFGEICFEVSAVGRAGFRVNGDFELEFTEARFGFEAERAQEAAQDAESATGLITDIFTQIEGVEDVAEGGKQEFGEGFSFPRFKEGGVVAGVLCVAVDAVEDNGFADAAQTNEDHAAGMEAAAQTIEGDGGMIEDGTAPGELRWRRASTWGKGIDTGVHMGRLARYWGLWVEVGKEGRV